MLCRYTGVILDTFVDSATFSSSAEISATYIYPRCSLTTPAVLCTVAFLPAPVHLHLAPVNSSLVTRISALTSS